nr:RagB/SusD family nutrient uptake outer membrane protein [Clostridia bacterium]
EGKRWDDLVRWKAGERLEEPKSLLGARDPQTGEYRICYPGYESRTWYDKLYLHPIPKQELTLNNSLVQNPGWEN